MILSRDATDERQVNTTRTIWRVVIGTLCVALLVGCSRQTTVELTTQGHPRIADTRLSRFAVSHYMATHERQAKLQWQVNRSLNLHVAEAKLQPAAKQPAMQTGLGEPELLGVVGDLVHRKLSLNGYVSSPNDPQMVVGVDCVFGPYKVRNPMSGATGMAHAHAVAMHVYASGAELDRPIWTGTAIAVCDEPAFAVVAPYLVDELVKQYPRGGGETRIVSVVLPGDG